MFPPLLSTLRSSVHLVLHGVSEAKIAELHRIGLTDIDARHVVTSAGLARVMLQELALRPLLLVDDSLRTEFEGLETASPTAVVIGLAPDKFEYTTVRYHESEACANHAEDPGVAA